MICTIFSVTALETLERSPLELAPGVYVAASGVLPVPNCEIVNAHEPAPLASVPEQESPNPSVTLTVPVGVDDDACTEKFTVTGLLTNAKFVGRETP